MSRPNMFTQFSRRFDGDRVLTDRPLFVGSVPEDKEALESANITHIVAVGGEDHLAPQVLAHFSVHACLLICSFRGPRGSIT